MTPRTVGHAGDLAYVDSFAALVPVKVVRVITPGNGWNVAGGPDIASVEVQTTAARPAFPKGETFTIPGHRVVPRSHVRHSNGHVLLSSNYRWE